MIGAHDLGGQQGLGKIDPEPETTEPVFHAHWERQVFALTLASGMLGKWNIDEVRFARERQHPVSYLSNSYYENWLAGLETLLAEKHLVDAVSQENLRVPLPAQAEKILRQGSPTLVQSSKPALYQIGDRIRVRHSATRGHTRVPRYVQGAVGIVAALRGCHLFADARSAQQVVGEHLYSVQFGEQELWGHEEENAEVFMDLWEPYLQSCTEDVDV